MSHYGKWKTSIFASFVSCVGLTLSESIPSVDASASTTKQSVVTKPSSPVLLEIYKNTGTKFEVPWSVIAGIDRYAELTKSKEIRTQAPYYGYCFDEKAWSGLANPNQEDLNPATIKVFHGLGVDGDGDGLAVPWDERDRIATLASYLEHESESEDDDMPGAVWNLLQDEIAMDRVFAYARIFQKYGLDPKGNCFPVAKRYNYTVKHTFGVGRSWGGRRIHEGVDIFAGYGTPVLASAYGYVELQGWNRFGGWRIGIRDTNSMYYYYAHLSSFAKGIQQGDLVVPGQVLGYVGSSGYGPPGTSGKFPPHLHYGIYRDTGRGEWAYNPSSLLSRWERQKQTIIYPSRAENSHRSDD